MGLLAANDDAIMPSSLVFLIDSPLSNLGSFQTRPNTLIAYEERRCFSSLARVTSPATPTLALHPRLDRDDPPSASLVHRQTQIGTWTTKISLYSIRLRSTIVHSSIPTWPPQFTPDGVHTVFHLPFRQSCRAKHPVTQVQRQEINGCDNIMLLHTAASA